MNGLLESQLAPFALMVPVSTLETRPIGAVSFKSCTIGGNLTDSASFFRPGSRMDWLTYQGINGSMVNVAGRIDWESGALVGCSKRITGRLTRRMSGHCDARDLRSEPAAATTGPFNWRSLMLLKSMSLLSLYPLSKLEYMALIETITQPVSSGI